MAIVQEFLKANEAYASTFHKGDLAMPPARHVAVLVCMDARIDPARAQRHKASANRAADRHICRIDQTRYSCRTHRTV